MQPKPLKSRPQVAIQQTRAFQTRSALLDAAERLLSRNGPGSLTLDQVALEAELSKGAILYHFPNKDTLQIELAKRLCLDCFEEADSLRASCGESWCESLLTAVEAGSTKYANLTRILSVISDLEQETWADVSQEVMNRLTADGLDENARALMYCVINGFCIFTAAEAQEVAPRVKLAFKQLILRPANLSRSG